MLAVREKSSAFHLMRRPHCLIQPLNRAPSHVLTVKKRSIQGLGECVDLIVILPDGKRHDLLSELIEP